MKNIHYGVIYKITNRVNNKSYIGQTVQTSIYRRLRKYRKLECSGQPKIYRALKKYGPDNFSYDIIDHAADQTNLDLLEDSYIIHFNTIKNGYNCKKGGANGKYSLESIAKLSESMRGKKHSEETKRKISENNRGKHFDGIGRKLSEETKQKMSVSQIGKTISDETKNKISLSHKGLKHSKETKQRMSETRKGMTPWNKGIKLSNETKKKMSEAHKKT